MTDANEEGLLRRLVVAPDAFARRIKEVLVVWRETAKAAGIGLE